MSGLTVSTNVGALNISRRLGINSSKASDHAQNLASGTRITRAATDAAALSIGNRLEALVSNMEQSRRNAIQGNALMGVAVGGAQQIAAQLDRMKLLTSITASDGVDDDARSLANEEFTKLVDQIDKLAQQTRFNGVVLLDSTTALSFNFQVNTDATDTLNITMPLLAISDLNITGDITTRASTSSVATLVDAALTTVREAVAEFGAFQAQLQSAADNLAVGIENAKAAKSSFVDANVAEEMIEKSKYEMLMQTGFSALGATFRNLQQLAAFVHDNG